MADNVLKELLLGRMQTPALPERPEMFQTGQAKPPSGPSPRDLKLNDPSGRFSGLYNSNIIGEIIRSAKKFGEDPLTALAMGLQETRLGRDSEHNPMHFLPLDGNIPGEHLMDPRMASHAVDAAILPESLDASMVRWQQNKRRVDPTDEELAIQSYNGLGRISPGQYGSDVPLNGRRDRPYGKRVMELRDNVLKPNEQIQEMIKRLVGG